MLIRRTVISAVLAAIVLVACLRVIDTYPTFNHTHDAAAHIAAGLQWLQDGEFNLETMHPPLARVSVAVGPYLKGARNPDEGGLYPKGLSALHDGGDYWGTLAAARAGILPFLALIILTAFLWGNAIDGAVTGLIAAAVASLLPPLLGNAGVAATDVVVASLIPLALLAFWRWLAEPRSLRRVVFMGSTVALAVLAKFTATIFIMAGATGIFVYELVSRESPRPRVGSAVIGIVWAAVVAFVVIWGGYRFSVGTVKETSPARIEQGIDLVFGAGGVRHDLVAEAADWTIPAPELPAGLLMAMRKGAIGHASYFMGENAKGGWPGFFPIALAVKTPISVLVLMLAGVIGILTRKRFRRGALPLTIAIALLLSVIPSPVALGVRHVLPIYPFLAVIAAIGLIFLARLARATAAIGAGLVVWLIIETSLVHPDYLSYMNVFGKDKEPPVLINADLDWGQDLARLSRRLDELGVESVNICWPWTARLDDQGLGGAIEIEPYQIPSGWTALSITCIYRGNRSKPYDQYAWAKGIDDYELVGNTIRLYRLP
jgi:4-amino-4-deoxy-L-arabinose transferase-like glycosyltransferase